MSNPWKLLISLFLTAFLLACPTRDPFAVNANCPADAPCFLSVLAPRGQTAAPGPYNMVVEVTGHLDYHIVWTWRRSLPPRR